MNLIIIISFLLPLSLVMETIGQCTDMKDLTLSDWETVSGDWNNHSKYICLKGLKWGAKLNGITSMHEFCTKYGLATIETTSPLDWTTLQKYLRENHNNCEGNTEFEWQNCNLITGIQMVYTNVANGYGIHLRDRNFQPYFVWALNHPAESDSRDQIIQVELQHNNIGGGSKSHFIGVKNLINEFISISNKVKSIPCCQFEAKSDPKSCYATSLEVTQKKKNEPDFVVIGYSYNFTWMLSRMPLTISDGKRKCEAYNGGNKSVGYTYYTGDENDGTKWLGDKSPLAMFNEDLYVHDLIHKEFIKRDILLGTTISSGQQSYGRLFYTDLDKDFFVWNKYKANFNPALRTFALCYYPRKLKTCNLK